MQVLSRSAPSANEAASTSLVAWVVLDQRRLAQHADNIVQRDIFLHHLLMGMRSDAQAVRFCLLVQAIRYRLGTVNVHINHDIGAFVGFVDGDDSVFEFLAAFLIRQGDFAFARLFGCRMVAVAAFLAAT